VWRAQDNCTAQGVSPFDEIDHTLMSMLLAKLLFKQISWEVLSLTVGVVMVLHLISNAVGYDLKIKDVPY